LRLSCIDFEVSFHNIPIHVVLTGRSCQRTDIVEIAWCWSMCKYISKDVVEVYVMWSRKRYS
jgi:hypothetical protein